MSRSGLTYWALVMLVIVCILTLAGDFGTPTFSAQSASGHIAPLVIAEVSGDAATQPPDRPTCQVGSPAGC